MSPLLKLQMEFAALVPRLIDKAIKLGYGVTLGDAYRDPRVFGMIGVSKGYGHPKSAHKRRIAQDLNLYKSGIYCDDSEEHRQLGEWWEGQHRLARWGGRWGDGNHYSFEWEGTK
jgi:hypothetical protein